MRLPKKAQQGRQERQGRGKHAQHRDRRRHGQPVEEVDAERAHPHQGDDDGDPREDHRAAGRVHRERDRAANVAAVRAIDLAVAGDDEERVIDADAEPDHQRQLRREVGHAQHPAAQTDQTDPGAEPEQGRRDRQAHRQQRAEADQQHDDRRPDPDQERVADRRLLGLLDRLPAQLDAQARGAGGRRHVDHPLRRGRGEDVRALVEGDRREADRAVPGDRPASRRVRAGHRGDVRQARDPAEHLLDLRTHRRRGQRAARRAHDDLVGVARLGGEAAGEQVGRPLRVGARQREVVREVAADDVRDRQRADEDGDPERDHQAAVIGRPAGEGEHRFHLGGNTPAAAASSGAHLRRVPTRA